MGKGALGREGRGWGSSFLPCACVRLSRTAEYAVLAHLVISRECLRGDGGDPYLLRGINCNCTSETETETLSRLSCCCDATRRRCDGLDLGGYG